MTIDKAKLKALAEEAGKTTGWYQVGSFGLSEVSGKAEQAFIAAATPETILALLAEIERLEFEPAKHARRLIDQLKAENEALRKQVVDLSPFKNASPQDYRASNKCLACGEYHHGLGNLPCPRCTPVAQSAMAKEASNG